MLFKLAFCVFLVSILSQLVSAEVRLVTGDDGSIVSSHVGDAQLDARDVSPLEARRAKQGCKKTGALAKLINLRGKATAFCGSYLSIGTSTTNIATVTPTLYARQDLQRFMAADAL